MNAPSEIAQASIRQRLDHHELARLLPYKSPWLLIDRVTAWSEEGITVHKAISGAEANMAAHLSQGPSIMPGVLQIEFVNQAVMLLMILLNMSGKRSDNLKGGTGILAKTRARFHSPAFIGDVITAQVKIIDVVENKTVYEGEITCGDHKVATIECIGAQIFEGVLAA